MTARPLVSVVLGVYNGEKYLQEQIDSILGQTHRNLEIIALDDVSADRSFLILQDPPLRLRMS